MIKDPYRIKAFSFMLWWLVCTVMVWPLTLVALAVVSFPLGMVIGLLFSGPLYDYEPAATVIMWLVLPAFFGAVIGLTVSHLQRWLLRTKLFWAAEHWRRWSILGAIAGAYAAAGSWLLIQWLAPYRLEDDLTFFIAMPVLVTLLSAMQWITLRHAVKDAWLWILANAIAGLVFSSLIIRNQPGPYNYNGELIEIGLAIIAVLVQGVITGYVLLFLFEKKAMVLEPEPVAIENHPKSVWDEAI